MRYGNFLVIAVSIIFMSERRGAPICGIRPNIRIATRLSLQLYVINQIINPCDMTQCSIAKLFPYILLGS
jgi:hypothetical protein